MCCLLYTSYSEVLPKTVELTTKFSRNIELKVPFVTAAMDTDVYKRQDKDMIKGLLAELDENGNTKEGGIQVEGAVN